jgi:hypothetical protein
LSRRGIALLLAVCGAASLEAQSASPLFPMAKGTTWTYTGTVGIQGKDAKLEEIHLSWQTEVVESVDRGPMKAALVRGDPRDFIWYSGEPEHGCYLVITVEDRELYFQNSPACVLPPDPSLALSPENLRLKLPARVGDIFAADPERKNDGRYAWCVESVNQVNFSDVKGVPQDRNFDTCLLMYRTNPDHQIATYVPGIGLTEYVYSHHGTPSEVHMKLAEFHSTAK